MSRAPMRRPVGHGGYSQGRGDWTFTRADLIEPEAFYRQVVRLDLRPDGGWLRAKCPICRSQTEALLIDPKRGAFVCVGCGKRGKDTITFYQAWKGLGFTDAIRALSAAGGRR